MKEVKYVTPALYFLATFVAVYFFFLNWETKTVYGDDLFIFNDHFTLSHFSDQLNILIPYHKYRPVHGVVFNVLIDVFQKNTHYYYLFNVFILALNFSVFALIAHLFLESYFFSFLFSLAFGLSRFFLYFVNQLLTGGASEGLGLLFFLCILYLVLRVLLPGNLTSSHKYKYLLLSILLANLNIYTLEKYIVVFVFLLMVVVFFQRYLQLTQKQRFIIGGLAVISPLLNVAIKKYVYSMPFFMGTGSTEMKFSLTQALGFLGDAIVAICQVNPGPEYLTGIQFSALPGFEKMLVYFVIAIVFFALLICIVKGYRLLSTSSSSHPQNMLQRVWANRKLTLLLLLASLFFLSLLPAVATIRLEQRWLTAPFAVFLLMLLVIFSSVKHTSAVIKYSLVTAMAFALVWTNNTYLTEGVKNTYMFDSERTAGYFKKGVEDKVIHSAPTTLYLWGKVRDDNYENGMYWVLDSGNFFNFYGGRLKRIVFVDSIYTKSGASSFPAFDTSKDQILFYWVGEMKDVTSQYMTDSLKAFVASYK